MDGGLTQRRARFLGLHNQPDMSPQSTARALAAALFLAASSASATVWTVTNDDLTIAQFDNLTMAHGAASPGDTILIVGNGNRGGTAAMSLDLAKRLTIMGSGYHRDQVSRVASIRLLERGAQGPGASDSRILGLVIGSLDIANGVSDVLVKRCRILGRATLRGAHTTLSECFIDNIQTNGVQLYGSYISIVKSFINKVNFSNNIILFENNVFFSGPTPALADNTVTFTRNIFINRNTSTSNPMFRVCDRCNMTSNLFYRQETPPEDLSVDIDNRYTNDFAELGFVAPAISGNQLAYPRLPDDDLDYRLLPTSIARGIQTRTGWDAGVHAFGLVGPPYRLRPQIPVVDRFDLYNPVVPLNTVVEFRAEVSAAQVEEQ